MTVSTYQIWFSSTEHKQAFDFAGCTVRCDDLERVVVETTQDISSQLRDALRSGELDDWETVDVRELSDHMHYDA